MSGILEDRVMVMVDELVDGLLACPSFRGFREGLDLLDFPDRFTLGRAMEV
jgi:hypothetical protein